MAIWATVTRWFGFGGASDYRGQQLGVPASISVDNTLAVGFDGSLQIATVWACINLYVNTISTLPLVVYRTRGDSQSPDEDAALSMLLRKRPNRRMTTPVFLSAMLLNLMARGNAYARIERNADGSAVELWPMAADQVEPFVLDDGTLVYRYTLGSDVAILAAENVLHLRGMGNGTVGLSRFDYMRATTSEATRAAAHSDKIFGSAGKPSGVLMIDKVLDKAQRAAIRQNFDDIATGDTARLFVLEANMKYEQISMSPADVQLLESRQFSVAEIGRWFGVPSALINAVDMTNHADILEAWFKTAVRPLLVLIECEIAMRVLTPRERSKYVVEFNFEALLRATTKDRYAIYGTAVEKGFMTRNEVRRLENLPRAEGADDLTAQVNLVPLAMLGKVKNGTDPQNAAAG